MARQNKQGLDYFPLNVFMDDKIELLEAEHGLSGFAIYIKLLQKIYSEGYFYYLGQDELLLTSKRINVDINSLNVVINCCIKRNLFNNVLFEKYSILTSQGIQKRFIEATLRRKEIEIVRQYWLDVDCDCNRVKIIDVDINKENVDIKNQSKVKESKGEKSIDKDTGDKSPDVVPDKRSKFSDIEKPEDVDQQVWDDFVKNRRAKKAPITKTAFSRIVKEAEKAGISLNEALKINVEKGWKGFEAEWLVEKKPKQIGLFGNNAAEQKSELAKACERKLRESEEAEKANVEEDSLPF